jgi:uncharacterized protein (DUF2147 family)
MSPVTLLTLSVVAMTAVSVSSSFAADKPQTVKKTDSERLLGRWVRTDGGYILELKEDGKDGALKAAYFNPRSINVSRAEWKHKEGRVNLFVELRDTNYPGSIYNLTYDPGSDRLVGTYYQAVQKETYNIEFSRSRE